MFGLMLVMSGCGATAPTATTQPEDGAPTATAPQAANAVTIEKYAYGPATLTVKKGTTVTWTNKDVAKHTVTVDSGTGPASAFFGQNETYSYTFDTVGVFPYHCEPHPYMKGTVEVVE